jgi:hypothetical protein
MRRRNFLSTLIGAAAVAGLGLPKFAPEDYDRFLLALGDRLREKARQGYKIAGLMIDPIEEIGGEKSRFVRLWVIGRQKPFTWHQFF